MGLPDGDAQLALAAGSGDRVAFARLVERFGARVWRLAQGLVRHPADADELAQEAWIRAWQALPEFRAEAAFPTWMHRIVVNLCLDFLKRRREHSMDDAEWTQFAESGTEAAFSSSPPPNAEDQLARRQRAEQVQDALDTLSPAHRTVLVLREIEELSYEEIAETLNVPTGTVMSRLFHARKALAVRLRLNDVSP